MEAFSERRYWIYRFTNRMKLFVSIGTQLNFDRLITYLNEYKNDNNHIEFTGQFSNDMQNKFNVCSELEYERMIMESDLVVGHVGTGTILNCKKYNKKLIVMPRLYWDGYKEHRNDHQNMSIKYFNKIKNIKIVLNKNDLFIALDNSAEINKMYRDLEAIESMRRNLLKVIKEL